MILKNDMKNAIEKKKWAASSRLTIKTVVLLFGFLLVVCCSSNSKTKNDDSTDDEIPAAKLDSIVFTVIGDVPYDDDERTGLI